MQTTTNNKPILTLRGTQQRPIDTRKRYKVGSVKCNSLALAQAYAAYSGLPIKAR